MTETGWSERVSDPPSEALQNPDSSGMGAIGASVPMPPAPPAAGIASAEPGRCAGQVVAIIDGDRPCIGCAYNLVGQAILRETHYGLLVVRCPECGKVDGIEEHPFVGRTVQRLATAGLGLWIILLVGFAALTVLLLTALSWALAEWFTEPLSAAVREDFQRWISANSAGGFTSAMPLPDQQAAVDAWLAEVGGIRSFLEARKGALAAIDPWAATWSVPLAGLLFAAGVAWSVALLGVGRRRLVAVTLGLVAIAGLIVAGEAIKLLVSENPAPWWALLRRAIAPVATVPAQAIGLFILAAALILGAQLGRPIARGLVRLFLPPRLRTPMAFLWIADGLAPPGLRRDRAAPPG
ncbi:MAG TPA: hypothetical protein PKC43_04910 [Phycisphaerales bacterium]|nr:hypothetical protein [Phycisphaerales bacterium]HMP36769.1 hypothetical protein [Phycisphaerales bacterium]